MYNERMLQIDNGLFSPMVFAVNGIMGLEGNAIFSRITESILIKNGIPKSVTTNFLLTKISFSVNMSEKRVKALLFFI